MIQRCDLSIAYFHDLLNGKLFFSCCLLNVQMRERDVQQIAQISSAIGELVQKCLKLSLNLDLSLNIEHHKIRTSHSTSRSLTKYAKHNLELFVMRYFTMNRWVSSEKWTKGQLLSFKVLPMFGQFPFHFDGQLQADGSSDTKLTFLICESSPMKLKAIRVNIQKCLTSRKCNI